MVPRTLDTWAKATALGPRASSASIESGSSWPSSVTPMYSSVAPRSSQINCQGTTSEWCSISVTSTRSPGFRFARPQAWVTRLSEAVALAVKIVSSRVDPSHAATLSRAPSYSSVASEASGGVDAAVDRGTVIAVVVDDRVDHHLRGL